MAAPLLTVFDAPGRSTAVQTTSQRIRAVSTCAVLIVLTTLIGHAQDAKTQADDKPAVQKRIVCQSDAGERQHCAADTSAGVALVKSTGSAPCLLGKTWGYDDTGIWTSDGCSGEFIAGKTTETTTKEKTPEYIPNIGFLLYDGEKGQIYFRLFSYARYLDQLGLNPTYIDHFGNPHDVLRQQNVDLVKFFAPFSGWFLTPKFRYYLYVWSSNASQ